MSVKSLTAKPVKRTVGDPSDSYNTMLPLWERSRAVLQGEAEAKAHDEDVGEANNLLIPFSTSMSQMQFDFFKKEAELPGLTAQYGRSLVASLLRKESVMDVAVKSLSEEENSAIASWLKNEFTLEGQSLFSFLNDSLWEEIQTFGSWIYVDTAMAIDADYGESEYNIPYASLYKAESVINVQLNELKSTGRRGVTRFVTRYITQEFTEENPWHPTYVDTVKDHYLDEAGLLVIQEYRKKEANVDGAVSKNGQISKEYKEGEGGSVWIAHGEPILPLKFGVRLNSIPAWPFNGMFQQSEPPLMPLIDREVALYNKVSRRNHLMYGASTYTPVITGLVDESEQLKVVGSGLGSWLFLPEDVTASMLETPSGALSDMETTISGTVDEMAKMGIRMLAPESTQSGVALEIRNSTQRVQLGTLNAKVSEVMSQVLAFMISWRYDVPVTPEEVTYTLSSDFSATVGGADAMRLVTEWYQSGLIPRTTFIEIAKFNDYIPADYNDMEAVAEIESDPLVLPVGQEQQDNKEYLEE